MIIKIQFRTSVTIDGSFLYNTEHFPTEDVALELVAKLDSKSSQMITYELPVVQERKLVKIVSIPVYSKPLELS